MGKKTPGAERIGISPHRDRCNSYFLHPHSHVWETKKCRSLRSFHALPTRENWGNNVEGKKLTVIPRITGGAGESNFTSRMARY
ncbi:MAG: hypothetical protein Ct9H300mP27_09530 [Chloroflexota bacterium]|nr:MAG: hypothetical protein Ct9H300mP27_09530 [Chloroflexota bacterium]